MANSKFLQLLALYVELVLYAVRCICSIHPLVFSCLREGTAGIGIALVDFQAVVRAYRYA